MRAIVLGAGLLLLGCHHFGELSFPAEYIRQGDSAMGAPSCAGISQIAVIDPRPNPSVVGDRIRDDEPPAYPVTMTGDVSGWIRTGFESQARSAGFLMGNSAHPTLQVTVKSLEVHEKVASHGGYNSRLVVDVAVISATGAICFTNSYEGAGKNFGSDGSIINYQETMNRGLDKTVAAVLNTQQVRDALCGQCAGTPVTP